MILYDSFDSFFHVFVNVSPKLPVNVLSLMCIEVRDTLMRVINEVTRDLRYNPDRPVVVFFCNHQHNPAISPHAAKYMKEGDYLLCTRDNISVTDVTDNQRLWLQGRFNISSTKIIVKFRGQERKSVKNLCLTAFCTGNLLLFVSTLVKSY